MSRQLCLRPLYIKVSEIITLVSDSRETLWVVLTVRNDSSHINQSNFISSYQ